MCMQESMGEESEEVIEGKRERRGGGKRRHSDRNREQGQEKEEQKMEGESDTYKCDIHGSA